MKERADSTGVLVDTSVWSEFFRGDTPVAGTLVGLLEADRVVTTGVVIYEIAQGIRSTKEKLRITALLSDLTYIEMTRELWESAGATARSLRERGVTLPVSDILLAAIALKRDLTLLTLDTHFDSIPEVKRYNPATV